MQIRHIAIVRLSTILEKMSQFGSLLFISSPYTYIYNYIIGVLNYFWNVKEKYFRTEGYPPRQKRRMSYYQRYPLNLWQVIDGRELRMLSLKWCSNLRKHSMYASVQCEFGSADFTYISRKSQIFIVQSSFQIEIIFC